MLIRININNKIIIFGLVLVFLFGIGIVLGKMLPKKDLAVKTGVSQVVKEKSGFSGDIFPQLISENFSLVKVEKVPLTGCYQGAKEGLSSIYERRSRNIGVTITEYESNQKALAIPKLCTEEDATRLGITPIFRKTGEVLGNPFWLYTIKSFNEEEIRYSYTVFKNYVILVMITGQLGGTESWHQEIAKNFVKALNK